jgi:hypothetical protein
VDHQPLQEVLAAWLQIQNLLALQASCNGELQIKLEAVSTALEDGYEVVFELVTTGELTVDAKNDLAAFQSTIAELEHPEASLTLVDSTRSRQDGLRQLARTYRRLHTHWLSNRDAILPSMSPISRPWLRQCGSPIAFSWVIRPVEQRHSLASP